MRLSIAAIPILLFVLCNTIGAGTPSVSDKVASHPDFSGFWNLDMHVPRDLSLMRQVKPDTVFLDDTGPKEFPLGDYGGLELTPSALEKAQHWDPLHSTAITQPCRPPSIVYAMQGPFPIEIFQSPTFIVMKLEYYDLVRFIFLDGRRPEIDYPHSLTGFSSGHWEGSTLVVVTDHLEAATITNNGLDHSENVQVLERFRLSVDGKHLLATQEFEDHVNLKNRGVRFIAWTRVPGEHVYPYECDPNFASSYATPPAK